MHRLQSHRPAPEARVGSDGRWGWGWGQEDVGLTLGGLQTAARHSRDRRLHTSSAGETGSGKGAIGPEPRLLRRAHDAVQGTPSTHSIRKLYCARPDSRGLIRSRCRWDWWGWADTWCGGCRVNVCLCCNATKVSSPPTESGVGVPLSDLLDIHRLLPSP